MDLLYFSSNLHTSTIQNTFALFSCLKFPTIVSSSVHPTKQDITMSTVTPAHATTQLFTSDSPLCSTFILPQRIVDLSVRLQINFKIPTVSSGSIGQLQPVHSSKNYALTAAHQPKRPVWTRSNNYIRAPRTNTEQIRVLVAELNMIRSSKITRTLKPRESFRSRRQDAFIWGRPSPLREINNEASMDK